MPAGSDVPVDVDKAREIAGDIVSSLPHRDARLLSEAGQAGTRVTGPREGWGVRLDWIFPEGMCSNEVFPQMYRNPDPIWYTRSISGNDWPITPVPTVVYWKGVYSPNGQPLPIPAQTTCINHYDPYERYNHVAYVSNDQVISAVGVGVWTAQVSEFMQHSLSLATCSACWAENADSAHLPPEDSTRPFFRRNGTFDWDWWPPVNAIPAWDIVPIKADALPALGKFWLELQTDPIWPLWKDAHDIFHEPFDYDEGGERSEAIAQAACDRVEQVERTSPRDPGEVIVSRARKASGRDKDIKDLTKLLVRRSLRGWEVLFKHRPDLAAAIPTPIRMMMDT